MTCIIAFKQCAHASVYDKTADSRPHPPWHRKPPLLGSIIHLVIYHSHPDVVSIDTELITIESFTRSIQTRSRKTEAISIWLFARIIQMRSHEAQSGFPISHLPELSRHGLKRHEADSNLVIYQSYPDLISEGAGFLVLLTSLLKFNLGSAFLLN